MCIGHIGTLTAKLAKNASHSHIWACGGKPYCISVGMSEVPASATIQNIAISISTDPSRV